MNNDCLYVLYDPKDNDFLSAVYSNNVNTCEDWYNAIRFETFSDADFFAAICYAKYETRFEVVFVNLTFELVRKNNA